MEELESALARSLANQKALQESLQEMIEGEERLRQEFGKERCSLQRRIDDLTRQLEKRSAEFEAANRQLVEFTEILEESKKAIESREEQLQSKQSSIRKLNELIREQKKRIQQLDSEKLYNSIDSFECQSCRERETSRPDTVQLYELKEKYERQIVELEHQLTRLQQALENNSDELEQQKKESMDFKRWLNRMVGVDRVVVAGCQKVIMREIEKRLAMTSYNPN